MEVENSYSIEYSIGEQKIWVSLECNIYGIFLIFICQTGLIIVGGDKSGEGSKRFMSFFLSFRFYDCDLVGIQWIEIYRQLKEYEKILRKR